MLLTNIVVLLAANLATSAAVAVGTSSDVINLDATDLQRRAACAAAGVVNGQCGRYYRGTGCSDQIGAIGPGRCSGQCYSSSDAIASLRAVGDGTYGTNCHLYYDSNCQNQIGETGNAIVGGGKCYTPPSGQTGHSLLCWYRC
ncbi:uncharacterized protein N0V96_000468 [Colletotrichum fioriniae]|uniref:uncharacterized protein n=1 Tax=Colletotrichum fioriniae TaxID=710243 RepID=UPI0023001E60|nr:uncharacterized protein COL516b_006506 [Colletotrichum fioriniae]KAJ0303501.1 hypothetical protein COL516b_006506 [Colletotrichum fioriniae]KAJ3949353.1 hypothetical protein N0V96_000468 [Colletotrichum fioriniae]